ncbi:MAG: hypothetical protein AAFQ68_13695 [Bacteroidota bacterium]
MSRRYYYQIIGKVGPLGAILVGVFFGLIGLGIMSFGHYWLGLLFVMPSLGSIFSFTAVYYDLKRMRIKHHINFFGLWIGSWQSIWDYPDVVVLSRSKDSHQRGFHPLLGQECSVYLMTVNHLKYIQVYRCFDREKANDKARKLSLLLNKDYVQYNPGQRRERIVKY